jgi:osmoprotectant transport system substrate-binding protein
MPPHRLRFRLRAALAVVTTLVAVCSLVVWAESAVADDLPDMRIASKNFAGAEVLSQLYGQALAAKGGHVTFQPDVGPTESTFEKLQQGEFDAYGEYQGTLLEFLGGKPSHDSDRTHRQLQQRLDPLGLTASQPAPAIDVNGFYVLRRTAERLKLLTMSDLSKVAGKLTFGGPPECAQRPLCLGAASERVYDLRFKKVLQLDAGGPQTGQALTSGKVDVALLFTGSSVIPKNAVLLRDDKGLQPAENPVLVVRKPMASPDLLDVVDAVSAKVTTAAYRTLSLDVSVRHQDPADVAALFLAQNNLP